MGYEKLPKHLLHGTQKWHFIDAKDQVLGRLASAATPLLTGKHKPIYTPHKDCGDFVVVVNARHVKLTGRKWNNKMYRWHTGYPGGLQERSAKWMREHKPNDLIHKAIHGMMQKNKLKKYKSYRLRVFPDEAHDHEDKLGKNPASILPPPIVEEDQQPEFEGIEDWDGTYEEFLAIHEYGSSWKKGPDGKKLRWGIYDEDDFPEDKNVPYEWDD